MDIFEFENYRIFIQKRFKTYPKKGHGQSRKLALHLGVSTAFVSQVLAETRHLTSDQAFLAADFFGLSDLETQYFLKLIDYEKAAHHHHRKWLKGELDKIQKQSKKVSERLTHQSLRDEDQARFYSDWFYSAIRMYCLIEPRTVDALAELIPLPRKALMEAIQFLSQAGLIIPEGERFRIGPLSTHVESGSPWVLLHHRNWRTKALEQMRFPSAEKVHYTSPMTLSRKDAEKIQMLLLKAIENIGKIVDPSPAEDFYCLNVDWFKVHSKP